MTQTLVHNLSDVKPSGIQRLNPRHMRMIELTIAGFRIKDIAETMNPPMTPQNVSLVSASPLFQDELSRQRNLRMNSVNAATAGQEAQASKILQDATSVAANTMVNLLSADKPEIRLASAKDILDRQGLGRGSTVPVTHITIERLQLLQVARDEAKLLDQQIDPSAAGSASCNPTPNPTTPEPE